ncbi:hypothetical protein [Rhizobium leguminosarum]|jgi:hypothetical protein|uniref:hypothetical protein n=1 Tax=Rhizobium leguminosarum TaxID=384 RepID=UPI000488DBCD|nr:hypothetical protein [Rhizobium leguminosarum]
MATLTAQNTFCPAVLKQEKRGYSVSISGTFVGKITVQRSPDDGVTWFDIASYTAPAELDGEFGTAFKVRAGFKTGDFTSGSAVVNVY